MSVLGSQWRSALPRLGYSASKLVRTNATTSAAILKKFPDLKESDILPNGRPDYVKMILTSRVYDVINESPLSPAPLLSQKLGSNILLKREDLLSVFSFKLRGAYNMIANLPEEKRKIGVIACSAGNHAQGVAYSAKQMGIDATIVMPLATPAIKYTNVGRLGAKVVLYGEDFDAAKGECGRLAQENGLVNIPPFNHPYVIAGQGTIALELLRQVKANKLSAVFVPIGGGGLITGILAYLKRLAPQVKVIGVETYDADCMYQSIKAGHVVQLDTVGLFADGTAVKEVGDEPFNIVKDFGLDEIVHVNTDEISAAIKDVFEDTRSVLEPSGAMSVAGARKYISEHPEIDHTEKTYVPVLSGANMNFDRLRFVSERAVLGEGKEVFLAVQIPDRPGTFRELHNIISPRSTTEFTYRYSEAAAQGSGAKVYTSFKVNDRAKELPALIQEMKDHGFEAWDLSDNELAKSHGRYLVGGKARVANERLIAFEFPEKPGALGKFLDSLQVNWNLTLFHYRDHGDDIGKVLAGISVPPQDNSEFDDFLKNLGYNWHEETENVAYRLFLTK